MVALIRIDLNSNIITEEDKVIQILHRYNAAGQHNNSQISLYLVTPIKYTKQKLTVHWGKNDKSNIVNKIFRHSHSGLNSTVSLSDLASYKVGHLATEGMHTFS